MRRRITIIALAMLFAPLAGVAEAGSYAPRRATVYGLPECDSNVPSDRAADGTYLRTWPHGVIASNALPMHTLIRTSRVIFGHRYWRVRDTGGGGGGLFDLFVPCGRLDPTWSGTVLYRVVRWGG